MHQTLHSRFEFEVRTIDDGQRALMMRLWPYFLKRMILLCWYHLSKLENLFEQASERDVSVAYYSLFDKP